MCVCVCDLACTLICALSRLRSPIIPSVLCPHMCSPTYYAFAYIGLLSHISAHAFIWRACLGIRALMRALSCSCSQKVALSGALFFRALSRSRACSHALAHTSMLSHAHFRVCTACFCARGVRCEYSHRVSQVWSHICVLLHVRCRMCALMSLPFILRVLSYACPRVFA